ncbi:hypothetical protein V2H45_20900 [Tumidithrix elongata RA019]|uniref:Type IV pilus biogenesis protein PilP n=1 Tax=Tumidithrix elongata BACA0141 TaxID=2716417 RepID=A0AAW9Q3V4_9CYAN|nr:hypothetical protein [Tumidithrix elongata RA019]
MLQNTQNRNNDQYFTTHEVDAFSDHADDLMDDLFGDVEHTLHVSASKKRPETRAEKKSINQILPYTPNAIATRPTANKSSEPPSSSSTDISPSRLHEPNDRAITHQVETPKDTVSLTRIELADVDLPPVSRQDILWIEPYVTRESNPPIGNFEPPINYTEAKRSNLLDRFLLVSACGSALLAAVMWSVNHGLFDRTAPKVSTVNNNGQLSPEKQQFAEEIRRSLENITDKSTTATNPNGITMPIGINSPIVSINSGANNGQLQMASPPVVGTSVPPLYIPVYQPPSPNSTTNPIALPPVSSTNGSVVEITPSNTQPITAPTVTSTAPSYTLIGVLDLGDRSSAMFDINGSMQTIGLGKQVGNSGWLLSRISQQEVTLRRGQATKSIFVGQKF